jgi:arsenate reductase
VTDLTLYHNPRCSKSRAALELLESRGLQATVVRYLDTPPSAQTLREVLRRLGMPPRALLRTGEEAYTTLNLGDPGHSDQALIDAMVSHPILIERPILVSDDRAAIGRPVDNLLELLP